MLYEANVTCPYCSETFSLAVDPSEGKHQNWVWDCEVCCQPIDVTATWNEEDQSYSCEGERSQ